MRKTALLLVLFLAIIFNTACSTPRVDANTVDPQLLEERLALIRVIRKFEQRFGFTPVNSFLEYSEEVEAYPLCYLAPRTQLPYSYEDPLLRSRYDASMTKEFCDQLGIQLNMDAFFYAPEAVAGTGIPVTPALIKAPLGRFVFVVIHEDYHEQVNLPPSIEEPAGTLLAAEMAIEFARERFEEGSPEHKAVIEELKHRYASRFAKTRLFNTELEVLYATYSEGEVSEEELLRKREEIFQRAQNQMNHPVVNNAFLAFDMSYARYYPVVEEVFTTLGEDLIATVRFFERVGQEIPITVCAGKALTRPACDEVIAGEILKLLSETAH